MPASLYRLPTVAAEAVTEFKNQRDKITSELKKEDSLLHRTLNANGVFMESDMKYNDAFYRFARNDPYNYVDGAREYLFFTKPDLPLVIQADASGDAFLSEPARDIPYFTDLAESPGYRKSVFCNLSYSAAKRKDGCPFIRILSNRKTSNMDIPDIQVEELETAVNMYGTKILYPKSSASNDEGIDFTVEFEDTRFLEIYHLFKVWDYYRSLKWYGILSPASFLKDFGSKKKQNYNVDKSILEKAGNVLSDMRKAITRDLSNPQQSYGDVERDYVGYIFHKVLHDHIRVFKFLVDNDGETLLYAASAIGCYPKTIQRSSFSEIPDKGPLKISIGFKVSGWFDDNFTQTIRDFNKIVESWVPMSECESKYWPLYDDEIQAVSQELVDVPFITKIRAGDEGTSKYAEYNRYILGWAKTKTRRSGTSSQWNTNYTSTDGIRDVKGDTKESMTDILAPNGSYITKNDYDYLKNNGYSDEEIQKTLFEDPKYAKPETSEEPQTEEQETPTQPTSVYIPYGQISTNPYWGQIGTPTVIMH